MAMPHDVIPDETALRQVLGRPTGLAVDKSRPGLDRHSRAFIARSPFLCIASSRPGGQADVSPRGDPPGFVLVLDDRRLLIPERPGNARGDTLSNILANPHVGLIFMVPGFEDTLRVNGRAWIERDASLLARLAVEGKAPKLAIGVEIDEAFLHCAKAFRRSRLWDPASLQDRAGMPGLARMIMEQVACDVPVDDALAERTEAEVEDSYRRTLY
jgi:PPOX class probable FMN-dependent enzyme